MNKLYLSLILLFFVACEQSVTLPENNSGRIMFGNAPAYLTDMLKPTPPVVWAPIQVDNGKAGMTPDPDHPENGVASPMFVGSRGGGQLPPTLYFPYGPDAGSATQYWIRYMRLDAGQHRFRLLDTAPVAGYDADA